MCLKDLLAPYPQCCRLPKRIGLFFVVLPVYLLMLVALILSALISAAVYPVYLIFYFLWYGILKCGICKCGRSIRDKIPKEKRTFTISNGIKDSKSAVVIGAGVAGLQAVRALTRVGVKVMCFERHSDIGGVWFDNYVDAGLQTAVSNYQFPEYSYREFCRVTGLPYKPGVFIHMRRVQAYIAGYMKKFDLERFITFRAEVTKTVQQSDGTWEVSYKQIRRSEESSAGGQEIITVKCDLLVSATGMYRTKNIPKFPGQDKFKGRIIHSDDCRQIDQLSNRHVVVIGSGKSSVDCSVIAKRVSKGPVRVIARSWQWPVPRFIAGILPFTFAAYTRFAKWTLPTNWYTTEPNWFMGVWVRKLYYKIVELVMIYQMELYGPRLPENPWYRTIFLGGQILTAEFQDGIHDREILCHKGNIEYLEKAVRIIETGETFPADVVVLGTGFKRDYSFYTGKVLASLKARDHDGLWCYRHILPTTITNFAAIGSELSTFCNIVSHFLQSEWLAACISGKAYIPSDQEMMLDIKKCQDWKRSFMLPTAYTSCQVQLHLVDYHDQLVADIGYKTWRKSNWFMEFVWPQHGDDFTGVHGAVDDKMDQTFNLAATITRNQSRFGDFNDYQRHADIESGFGTTPVYLDKSKAGNHANLGQTKSDAVTLTVLRLGDETVPDSSCDEQGNKPQLDLI